MQNCKVSKTYMPKIHRAFWKPKLFGAAYGHSNYLTLLKVTMGEQLWLLKTKIEI